MLGPQHDAPTEPAGAVTELTLVRHGRTIWHADNRYAGASDIPLDGVGRAQARALARWALAHRHDALACSPLRRARQTAAVVAETLGLHPEITPDLREMDFGIAEGHTLAEVGERYRGTARAFQDNPVRNPFPGAESPEQVAERVVGALRSLAEYHAGSSILVIGHSTAFRLALCAWLGVPLSCYRDVLPRLDNAAVTRLRVPADPARPPALLCLNASTLKPAAATDLADLPNVADLPDVADRPGGSEPSAIAARTNQANRAERRSDRSDHHPATSPTHPSTPRRTR